MRLDAHQHFVHYNAEDYGWMTGEMSALRRNFLPADLRPLLDSIGFDGSVVVQARQTLEETTWLLELAEANDWIKGVVGWVDLRSPDVAEQLDRYARHPKFKGVRHVLHDEPDDEFMLRPEFQYGISLLKLYDLTYDLLLFPRHLPVARTLVENFPDQPFVIDHIAKPAIKAGTFSPWREDLAEIARHDNVTCKLSGMVTEADWARWTPNDLIPYIEIVVDTFGADRLMIGSDWPVCTLCGGYKTVMNVVIGYLKRLSASEQARILGETCAAFYHIEG